MAWRPLASVGILATACIYNLGPSHAFQSRRARHRLTRRYSSAPHACDERTRLFFDIAIATPADDVPLGRLVFRITPPSHPHHLPLHSDNLLGLAAGRREALDPRATYAGCAFQYSPATIEDGSVRYRWGHVCAGHGRNAIQTTSAAGVDTAWDEPFADPQRMQECAHRCFGGVYYGQTYDEIAEMTAREGGEAAVALTVPIQGPGAGTSKFSIVRVSESPREWGERLLLNSAVVGHLECGGDGRFGGRPAEGAEGAPTSLEVLRAMARQKMGPPKIVRCGITPSEA